MAHLSAPSYANYATTNRYFASLDRDVLADKLLHLELGDRVYFIDRPVRPCYGCRSVPYVSAIPEVNCWIMFGSPGVYNYFKDMHPGRFPLTFGGGFCGLRRIDGVLIVLRRGKGSIVGLAGDELVGGWVVAMGMGNVGSWMFATVGWLVRLQDYMVINHERMTGLKVRTPKTSHERKKLPNSASFQAPF